MEGLEHHCEYEGLKTVLADNGRYCCVPVTHCVTLGEIVDLLQSFREASKTLTMPEMPPNSFAKKLYSTYLSYLPESEISCKLTSNQDERGSFTELIRTQNCGQVSVNITKPGITKGQHWHNSKWEIFIVRPWANPGAQDWHKSGDWQGVPFGRI